MESLKQQSPPAPDKRRGLAVTLRGFATAWRILTVLGVVAPVFLAVQTFTATERFDYTTMRTVEVDQTVGWVYLAIAIAILFQGLWAAALSDAAAELLESKP